MYGRGFLKIGVLTQNSQLATRWGFCVFPRGGYQTPQKKEILKSPFSFIKYFYLKNTCYPSYEFFSVGFTGFE